MIIKSKQEIPVGEITDPVIFAQRRKIIKAFLTSIVAGSGVSASVTQSESLRNSPPNAGNIASVSTATPYELVKNYTNYYEFTFDKQESASLAQKLKIDPWAIEITGEVEKTATFNLDDILSRQTLREYVYRFRCVEGWSMVIPWIGFPLAKLLNQVKPLSSAKFVKFTSVCQPEAMPLQRNKTMLDWPYVEGLRIDEATHPLTLLAVGMYGEILPKQNGAPLRLVVPWKYGFKSIKAIVKIELLKRAPATTWNKYAPNEYGFYANVNPDVPHPRWSQISERQIGTSFFTARRKTELFNGYGEQVASMYRDMDLKHFL
ncbi:MAG: protein-methionine-sulfoxide reductase catalytic subunit MsrP [Methylomonas sp.]|jgi:sulfoxide reductase catalytic subunit YedY